ncbi:DNA internalization-related competence protein ComEC/Rec2 [Zymobacter sp. IVIA_5232.4 C2]|uniref:DNA internalization-related competence protein ComEC/Rec2 n=1 Tax=Zymobacter sp. IVIA_5232.4 C2 TaxID=3394855 RepID=UPI0039C2EF4C
MRCHLSLRCVRVVLRTVRPMCRHVPLMPVTCAAACCLWVALLGSQWLWWGAWAIIVLSGGGWLWRRSVLGCLATLCCVIAMLHGHHARQAVLADALLNQPLRVEGKVLSLHDRGGLRSALFGVEQCHPLAVARDCMRLDRLQLSLPSTVTVAEGERWRLTVRLRPPHGLANPGQWDTVWRVRRQGIGGIGSVLPHPAPQRLSEAGWQPAAWLRRQIETSGVSASAQRWLKGMIVGDGSAFDDADWQLFNDTGTTHLVVVSGSHITLAVGFWAALTRWGMRRARPTRYRRATVPRAGAALAGIGYAVLAQGGAPAARACVALLPWVLAFVSRWRPSRWQLWWLALLAVLLMMPWSLLMPGVWLSFGAVAGLYVMHPHRQTAPSLWRLLYCHGAITLLMEGALLVMMERWAPLAFPANLIAIPWISLILMPLGMIGALCAWPCPSAAHGCWWLFDRLLAPLCSLLNSAAQYCPSRLVDPEAATAIGTAMMVVAVVSMLPCCTWRWRGILLLGSALLALGRTSAPRPDEGMFEVTVLDVGQGQLVELRTHRHRYLFDTGPQSRSGRRAIDEVWPAAQAFDGVIVSHGDLDHSGGIPSLRQYHHVGRWWAPWAMPALTAGDALQGRPPALSLCRAGQSWVVDGVRFRFLWPRPDQPLSPSENDRSCVLLVEGRVGRALFTGDASAQVEQWLLSAFDQPISVWVAGHHGSHSSNSRALLVRTRPAAMLYSTGYANRYHHPAYQTVERVREVGAQQWNTAETGAITVRFLPEGDVSIDTQRSHQTVVIRRL